MSAIVINGLPLRVQDQVDYNEILIGDRNRSACGFITGFTFGKAIDGQFVMPCLTLEEACDIRAWITPDAESWDWSDSTCGSRGTVHDPMCSVFNTVPQISTFTFPLGGSLQTLDLDTGEQICLQVGKCDEWTVTFSLLGSFTQNYVLSSTPTGGTFAVRNGATVPFPSWFNYDPATGLITIEGARRVGPITFRCESVTRDFARALDLNASLLSYSPVPYVTITGDLFKQPLKALVRFGSITRHTGNNANNLVTATVSFYQAGIDT